MCDSVQQKLGHTKVRRAASVAAHLRGKKLDFRRLVSLYVSTQRYVRGYQKKSQKCKKNFVKLLYSTQKVLLRASSLKGFVSMVSIASFLNSAQLAI